MPLTLTIAVLLGGLAVMSLAADRFVSRTAQLAVHFGIPHVVTGAVVVGLGTSLPELLVTGRAAAEGQAAIGIANVFGSNVANLTLVLGIATLIAPVVADRIAKTRLLPLAAGATLVGALAVLDGSVSRALDGLLLTGSLAVSVAVLLAATRGGELDLAPTGDGVSGPLWRTVVTAAVALVGVLAGAEAVVRAAIAITETFGLSGGFVGLTVVAVGTSLPELAAGAASARRGETSMLLGNVLGSNVWNTTAVLLAAVLAGPGLVADRTATMVGPALALLATLVVAVAIFARPRAGVGRLFGMSLLLLWAATIPLAA